MPEVLAEAALTAPELAVGLLGVAAGEALPDVLPPWCEPATPPVVEGATGGVGMAETPSTRPPPPVAAGDGSLVVGVGAAPEWVGTLAARLSIDVPIPPPLPPSAGDAVPLEEAWLGAACGVGEEMPDGEEPPLVPVGPDVLGALGEPVASGALCDGVPGEGSSKSDSDVVCLGVGMSEVEGFCPVPGPEPSESGPAPRSGVPTWVPPVSADIPPPMFVPGPLSERVDGEESDPDESEPSEPEWEPAEDESVEDEELEDESEDEELEDESEELFEEESESPSLPDEPESPSPSPEPSRPSLPDTSCPSMRLSMAWWARWPAFSPRLSRTPSARVCGV
ncbi:hypothetical protein ACWEWI_38370, partial [Streptomyces sp. NPDC003753]